jgi:hypothetical protein
MAAAMTRFVEFWTDSESPWTTWSMDSECLNMILSTRRAAVVSVQRRAHQHCNRKLEYLHSLVEGREGITGLSSEPRKTLMVMFSWLMP